MAKGNQYIKKAIYPWVWFRKNIYQDFYLRRLESLNEYMGGRAKSGAVGSHARHIRIAINILCLSIIVASIFLDGGLSLAALSTFWQSGAVLQGWAEGALLACMAINMIAVVFGTAANFSKIQQYTHLELTLEELINEKKIKNTLKPSERLPMPLKKRVMLFVRYLHDFNGLAGSAISLFLFVGCAMSFIFPGIYSMPLAMCAILFCTSRASSLVSVLFAPLTNQLRLHYYKGRTLDQINEYYAQHKLEAANQHTEINKLLDKVFTAEILASIPKQHELVRFACYRACERHDLKADNAQQVTDIQEALCKHFKERHENVKNPTFIPISAVEDTYMITEMVDSALSGGVKSSKQVHLIHRYPECLLEATLNNKLSKTKDVDIVENMKKSLYLISNEAGRFAINTDVVKNALPLQFNPHGAEFAPYHCELIANALVSRP